MLLNDVSFFSEKVQVDVAENEVSVPYQPKLMESSQQVWPLPKPTNRQKIILQSRLCRGSDREVIKSESGLAVELADLQMPRMTDTKCSKEPDSALAEQCNVYNVPFSEPEMVMEVTSRES